jgi:hypothetical protein
MYGNDIEEAKMLKQQQRQQELNSIVNDLSENLIDVSLFLNADTMMGSCMGSVMLKPDGEDAPGTFPVFVTDEERREVLNKMKTLGDDVRNSCKFKLDDELYLRF